MPRINQRLLNSCANRRKPLMKIWLVTIGEPVPVHFDCSERLHRTGQLARLAARAGHEVTWWTSTFDHFSKKQLFEHDSIVQWEIGLQIRLLKGCGYRSNVSLARFRDHREIAAKFATQARQLASPPDIMVAGLPTIELCAESVKYGTEHSVPVVLDMRDMWPDIFVDTVPAIGRPLARLLLAPMFRQARDACSGATAITGITDDFVDWGLRRGNRKKNSIDRSFAMGYSSAVPPVERIVEAETFWDRQGLTGRNGQSIACFFGTLGRQFDLETVIRAARRLQEAQSSIQFVLCGQGDRLNDYKKQAAGLSNVVFPGWVDAAAIHVLMRRSAFGLDPLPNRYDFLATINNKAIEYLSSGLPIISSPTSGVLAELLAKEQCGVSYHNGRDAELAEQLLRLSQDRVSLNHMSKQATTLFENKFRAEQVYAEMLEYFESLVSMRGSRSAQLGVAA